jgi:hypothetical protein
VSHVRKRKSRTITTIVEKKEPRKIVVRGGASGGYNYASNANQTNIAIIADSIDSQNANILVLVPAGREEDTVSFLFGSTDTRYAGLNSSSFDALNGSIIYTRLLGRRQTAEGLNTGGTATTDILTLGVDGTSVYEPGFGAEEISIATPSIGWSRSNIGLGSELCGEKGSESYATMATSRSRSARALPTCKARRMAGSKSTPRSAGVRRSRTCRSGRPAACRALCTRTFRAVGRISSSSARAISAGSGCRDVTLSAGVKFTQQISSHSDLDWNGFNVVPRVLFNMKFN